MRWCCGSSRLGQQPPHRGCAATLQATTCPSPLAHLTAQVKEVLKEAGFAYDSSDIKTTRGSGMGDRPWPYSLGGGLTEVPLWDLSATGQSFTMDYGE